MTQRGAKIVLNCFLYVTVQMICGTCVAQTSELPVQPFPQSADVNSDPGGMNTSSQVDAQDPNRPTTNSIGIEFLKNLLSDQKAIWTSPAHLHWADGTWLFPLAAVTAGFFATDRAVPPALSTDVNKLNRYTSVSNYGVYSLIGAGGGLYILGKLSHNDHERETGILAGEAAINSL